MTHLDTVSHSAPSRGIQAKASTSPTLALVGDANAIPPALVATFGRHYQICTLSLDHWESFWNRVSGPCVAIYTLTRQTLGRLESFVSSSRNTTKVTSVVCLTDENDASLWEGIRKSRANHVFSTQDSIARVDHCLAAASQTRKLREQALLRSSKLDHLHRTLRSFQMVDMDTGLYNRRYLLANLTERLALAKRYGRPLSLLACVVNNHAQLLQEHGDELLTDAYEDIADALQLSQRTSDLVARAADNIFVLVLPDTPFEGAETVAKRLVAEVSGSIFGMDLEIQVAAGIATSEQGDIEPIQFLDEAQSNALMSSVQSS